METRECAQFRVLVRLAVECAHNELPIALKCFMVCHGALSCQQFDVPTTQSNTPATALFRPAAEFRMACEPETWIPAYRRGNEPASLDCATKSALCADSRFKESLGFAN